MVTYTCLNFPERGSTTTDYSLLKNLEGGVRFAVSITHVEEYFDVKSLKIIKT